MSHIIPLLTLKPLLFLLVAWSLIWKGLALWNSARDNHLGWFIAILILNTAGILEIIYLLFFGKTKIFRPSKKYRFSRYWR